MNNKIKFGELVILDIRSVATWLSPVAIRLTYLAISGVAEGRISDLSQPRCVKELHILPSV